MSAQSSEGGTATVHLKVSRGEAVLFERALTEASISLGAAAHALVQLDGAGIGPLHCILNVTEDGVTVLDMGTDGGTLLNGERIASNAELAPGDVLTLGDLSVEVVYEENERSMPTMDVRPESAAPAAEASAGPAAAASADEETDHGTSPAPAAAPAAAADSAMAAGGDDDEGEQVDEDILDMVFRSGAGAHNAGLDVKAPKVLEVAQVWNNAMLDTKHFQKGASVSIGGAVGSRWSLLGVPLGWVPDAVAPILRVSPPIWSDVVNDWRSDFYASNDSLPSGADHTLFQWDGSAHVARIDNRWGGFVERDGQRLPFEAAVKAGLARSSGNFFEVPIAEGVRVLVDIDGVKFIAHQVHPGAKVIAALSESLDYPFLAIFLFCLFAGGMFGVIMATSEPPASNDLLEIEDRFVELLLEKPEPEKKENKKPDANPDAGEGAKAKKEEGKVGKKDAKMKQAKGNKVEVQKQQQDREIAENAGVLGAMGDAGIDGVFGSGGVDASLAGGIGGVLGAKGTQVGSGGLGSRGSGFGGGGTADGLGGLGTKGSGSGASGFGKGGGSFGAKGDGGVSAATGSPIILGALDRSLIDQVIKRKMSQIRYCYQRELQKNPTLAGKVVIKFTIAKDGSVSAASVKSSDLGNPGAEKCVVDRFYSMQFPEPKGGGIVLVSYPFIFSPG